MLGVENVSKTWGTFALCDVNLRIAPGEFFVLLGPSGAGKSLLLELIAGFHRPDRGRIIINGTDVTTLPPERRNVGLVHQDHMLFPHKTVWQNIAYGLQARRLARAAVHERVRAIAVLLRIEPLLERLVTRLSGGEKQRVALGRALAVRPDLLLLDEPFSSLDPPVKQELLAEVKKLQAQTGVTALHVTHERAEALSLGHTIGIIQEGRIRQVGSDLKVFEEPNGYFVAEFTGGTNIYSGEAVSNGALTTFTSGSLRLISTCRLTGPCRAMVRPENIILSRQPVRTSARNQLSGTVQELARRGEIFEVTARFADQWVRCIVTPQSVEELHIAPGAAVCFSFKAGSVHLFADDRKAVQEA